MRKISQLHSILIIVGEEKSSTFKSLRIKLYTSLLSLKNTLKDFHFQLFYLVSEILLCRKVYSIPHHCLDLTCPAQPLHYCKNLVRYIVCRDYHLLPLKFALYAILRVFLWPVWRGVVFSLTTAAINCDLILFLMDMPSALCSGSLVGQHFPAVVPGLDPCHAGQDVFMLAPMDFLEMENCKLFLRVTASLLL